MLILASISPRRRELLARLDLPFAVQPSHVEERPPLPEEEPAVYAGALARDKAGAVASRRPDDVVIGADTVVAIGRHMLGKPQDEADAMRMLQTLRGRTHLVATGVAVACNGKMRIGVEVAAVTFRCASDAELQAYIASGEPWDKAGGYAVQGLGGALVSRVDGCYNTVVGLPLRLTAGLLQACGLELHEPRCCSGCGGSTYGTGTGLSST